jgi:GDP-mannose 6-dehydrogenase
LAPRFYFSKQPVRPIETQLNLEQQARLSNYIMEIAIIGLGYVGAVSAGCLAKLGHHIIGVDIAPNKVALMASGQPPIHETGLDDLIAHGHEHGRITATMDIRQAVEHSDVALLAVGTPSCADGSIDDSYLMESVRNLGQAIRDSGKTHYVLMSRSTCPPPTHHKIMELLEETSGLSYDDGLAYVCHPEFLREGVAIADFHAPPKIVFGLHGASGREACEKLYPDIDGRRFFVSVETAAMVKYADNCFHAVKVTFANEMGLICKALQVDSHEVMEIFCADEKLNISSYYLRPGSPFGGSCLPKDLRGILQIAHSTGTPLKMLSGAYESNQAQIDALVERIMKSSPKVVGIVGLAFKEGTPDLRESPTVQLLQQLRRQNVDVVAYDEELASVDESHLDGLAGHLYRDLSRVVDEADVLVVYHGLSNTQWNDVDINNVSILDVTNVDFLRQFDTYEGLYWQDIKGVRDVLPSLHRNTKS